MPNGGMIPGYGYVPTAPTLFGQMPTLEALQQQAAATDPMVHQQRMQEMVNRGIEGAAGFGITAPARLAGPVRSFWQRLMGGGGQGVPQSPALSQEAINRMAAGAEQVTMQGPAPALAETMKSVQLYPQTILRHATNPLRRTPEQMAELTRAIQAEGVRPGAVQMWKMPEGGGLRLVEGHHTATVADLLDPMAKIPVSIMDAPLGQTLFK